MHKAEKTTARIKPVWFPAGDRGLLLDLTGYSAQLGGLPPSAERQALTRFARALGQRISGLCTTGQLTGITDLVPGLASLLIHYDPLQIRAEDIKKAVFLILEADEDIAAPPARKWRLPVLYGGEAGPDLEEVAAKCNISIERGDRAALHHRIGNRYYGLSAWLGLYDRIASIPASATTSRAAHPCSRRVGCHSNGSNCYLPSG